MTAQEQATPAMTTAAESDLIKMAEACIERRDEWHESPSFHTQTAFANARQAFKAAAQALADRVKELTFAGEQMMETLKGHQAEISRIQASNAEMRRALEPFAKAGVYLDSGYDRDTPDSAQSSQRFMAGDLRRAARATAEEKANG